MAKVTINNSWVEDSIYQNIDGVHAEESIVSDWSNILERYYKSNKKPVLKSTSMFVKYSPCKGKCAPKLMAIALQHPGVEFNIYHGELYVGKKEKELENSVEAIKTMKGAGIKIGAFGLSVELAKICRGVK